MLLLFRFIAVMIASFFRPRIDPLGESVVPFTVLPTDCDLNVHVNAGRYLSFMDVTRVELLGRTRLFRKVMSRGWRPIAGGAVVRFRRSLLPFERFTIRSRVIGWDEKWFYFEHLIERNGELCVTGHARVLLRHLKKKENIPTRAFLELAGIAHRPAPELPEFVKQWRDAENAR